MNIYIYKKDEESSTSICHKVRKIQEDKQREGIKAGFYWENQPGAAC